jgi:molybdopterin converting factor small subunit
MPKAAVSVYTTLRSRLGFARRELEGSTVGGVIEALCAVKEPDIRNILLDDATARGVKISGGDILHIFPPVSGG